MIKYVFRQLLCKHEYVNTNEMWSIFWTRTYNKVMCKCGKKNLLNSGSRDATW